MELIDDLFVAWFILGPAYGFDDTIRAVEQAWKLLGPFQGILGFSQGACLVGLICNLSLRGSK